jgi:hypothetical protein
MFKPLLTLLLFSAPLVLVLPANAQKGRAPNGYYPVDFQGDIFTGRAEAARPNLEELTLVYTKGKKTEHWVGRLESSCSLKDKAGQVHTMHVSDMFEGDLLTVFYVARTIKADNVKTTTNWIIALSRAEVDGKKIPEDKQVLIPCSQTQPTVFKVF